MKVTLHTIHDCGEQTLGCLTVVNANRVIFLCKSLELPDRNNKQGVSSIPAGTYLCKWTYSNTFKRNMYEVLGVAGRAGIRIHSANYASQLRGCIALGDSTKDLNKDGLLDITHSGNTVKSFEELMKGQDFYLEVKR
jgi:hypothetical protein